jgi:hypothetical protein
VYLQIFPEVVHRHPIDAGGALVASDLMARAAQVARL